MEAAIAGLIEAIQQRAWYPLAAYVLTLVIALWARWQPRLFEAQGDQRAIIPARWQWLPAVILAGAGAFVAAWSSGLSWQMAVGVAIYTMAIGGPAAVGVHRIGKEARAKITKKGGAGGSGLVVGAVLFLAVAIGVTAPACTGAKPVLRSVHDVARSLCAIYYGELSGMSVDDAAKAFCATEEALRPWIDEALRAQRAAAARSAKELDAAEPTDAGAPD